MTLREAYIYLLGLLEGRYEVTKDNDLGAILGDLGLWGPHSAKETPGDPAAWNDWVNAVRRVTSTDSLDDAEAMQAGVILLKEYDKQGCRLGKPIQFLQGKLDRRVDAAKTWKRLQPRQ